MREGIVANAIEHTFKKDREALKKLEISLAKAVYNELYDAPTQKMMNTLGEKFLERDCDIHVNVNGQRHRLYFDGERNVGCVGWKEREQRLMMRHQAHSPFVPSKKLGEDILEFADKTKDQGEREKQATIQLSAMLESVMSFKKLRAVWPQGEKFYDMYDVDSETKSGVPAVVVTELNKLLGL